MWTNTTITIPTIFVNAVLEGEIPSDSIVALLGFMKYTNITTPTEMNEFLGTPYLDTKIAWQFLQTGQVVNEHGEIVAESLESPTVNRATENWGFEEWTNYLKLRFKEIWPDQLSPTASQIDEILFRSDSDIDLIEDIFAILEASDKPITTPPSLMLWWLDPDNKPRDQIEEQAEIIRRKMASNEGNMIQKVLRDADAKMRNAPKPGVNRDKLERLRLLRDNVSG